MRIGCQTICKPEEYDIMQAIKSIAEKALQDGIKFKTVPVFEMEDLGPFIEAVEKGIENPDHVFRVWIAVEG